MSGLQLKQQILMVQGPDTITMVQGGVPVLTLSSGFGEIAGKSRALELMHAINFLRAGASAVQLVMVATGAWEEAKEEMPKFAQALEVHEGDAAEKFQLVFDDVNRILTMTREVPPKTVPQIREMTPQEILKQEG